MQLDCREEIDRAIYEEELADFLPEQIFDSHIHTALPQHITPLSPERRTSKLSFFADVAASFDFNPYEFVQEIWAKLLPRQRVEGLFFGYPFLETDLDANNTYVADLIEEQGVCGLYMPRPQADGEELVRALDDGHFIGYKPYPDFVPNKTFDEIRVADYVPAALWEIADERGAIVLVHLARPGRLYDPHDIQDMAAICQRYRQAMIIIAHIGRPYIPSMIKDGIPAEYKRAQNLWFDICPICESEVLETAIREVGPQRLLFATDSPITYMRGRLGEWKGQRKFFSASDFPWNVNREPKEKEDRYTFYIYEQLRALKKAAERTGLCRADVKDILYNNAKRLTMEARGAGKGG